MPTRPGAGCKYSSYKQTGGVLQAYGKGVKYNGTALSTATRTGAHAYTMYVKTVDAQKVVYIWEDANLLGNLPADVDANPTLTFRVGTGGSTTYTVSNIEAYDPNEEEPVEDPDLPLMPKGAINYAIDAGSALSNGARAQYDGTYGSWNFAGGSSGGATLDLTMENISENDEFVISYFQKTPAWTNHPNALKFTFGKDDTETQSVQINETGGTSAYTAADGTTIALPDCSGGAIVSIYSKPITDTTRNIYVYINGVLKAVDRGAPILPLTFNFVEGIANWSQSEYSSLFGLRVYKPDEEATEFEPTQTATLEQAGGLKSQYIRLAPQGDAENVVTLADMATTNATYDSSAETIRFTNNNDNGGNINADVSGLIGKSFVYRWNQAWGTSGDTRGRVAFQFAKLGNKTLDFIIGSGQTSYFNGNSRINLTPLGLGKPNRDIAIRVQLVTADLATVELYVDNVQYAIYNVNTSADDIIPYFNMTHSNSWGSMFITLSNFGCYAIDDAEGYVAPVKKTVTVPTVEGGTVTGAGTFRKDSSVTLTATADATHTFAGWSVGGAMVSYANPYTFALTEDVTVTPVYYLTQAIPENEEDFYIDGWSFEQSTEEGITYSELQEGADMVPQYAFGHGYDWARHIDVIEESIPEEETYGLDTIMGKSYVLNFKSTNLNYGNGWHGRVVVANLSGTDIGFDIASNGITYFGYGDSVTVSKNYQNQHSYSILVRREADNTTGIYMNVDGVQIFQTKIDFDVTAKIQFLGYWGEWDGWKVSHIEAYPVDDAEGAGEYNPPVFDTISIVDAQCAYTISGIVGGTKHANAHSWATATYLVVDGSEVTITAAESQDPAYVNVIKDVNNGWGVISNGNVYVGTIDGDKSFAVQAYARPYLTIIADNGTVQDIAEGYQTPQGSFSAFAVPDDGYVFDHWEASWKLDEDELPIEFTENPFDSILPATGDCELYAIFAPKQTVFTVTVNQAEGGEAFGQNTYAYGETVELSAYAADGYYFKYWLVNGRMYLDSVVTIPVISDITATPVFVNKTDSGAYAIHFYTADGRLISTFDSWNFDYTSDCPEVPGRYGYIAQGWDYVWEDGINSDIDVYPQYVKVETYYTLTVNGGSASASQGKFESIIRVYASETDGFIGWKNGQGEFVSFEPNFSFFIVHDIELTAVYDGEKPSYTISANPTSNNEVTSDEKFTLNFIGNTYVEGGYTLIERGIVYGTGDNWTTENLVIGGKYVKQKVASSVGNGQFMYTLTNAPRGTAITARAYMIVKDGNGVQTVVYSALCDCTEPLPVL